MRGQYGIRFESSEQAEAFVKQLSDEVARRLDSVSMCGKSLTLKVMKRDPSAPTEAPKVSVVPTGQDLSDSSKDDCAVHGSWEVRNVH